MHPGLGKDFDDVFATRLREADEFYRSVTPPAIGEDRARVHAPGAGGHALDQAVLLLRRRHLARGAPLHPLLPEPERKTRNQDWFHMLNDDVISMPDKWEYPWYAAWDLAFHCSRSRRSTPTSPSSSSS